MLAILYQNLTLTFLGGETIKDMQATTGCKINVSQASGADIEREIGLVGSRQAIEDAKRAIDEKVNQVVSVHRHPVNDQQLTSRRRRRMAAAVVVVVVVAVAVAVEIKGITTVTTATHTSSSRVTASPPLRPVLLLNRHHKEMPRPRTRTPSTVATTTIWPCGIPHSNNKEGNLAKANSPLVRRLPDVYAFE